MKRCYCCNTKFHPTHRHPDMCSTRCEKLYNKEKDHPGIYKIINTKNLNTDRPMWQGRWRAAISRGGKTIPLGGYPSWEEALGARLSAEHGYEEPPREQLDIGKILSNPAQSILCKKWTNRKYIYEPVIFIP